MLQCIKYLRYVVLICIMPFFTVAQEGELPPPDMIFESDESEQTNSQEESDPVANPQYAEESATESQSPTSEQPEEIPPQTEPQEDNTETQPKLPNYPDTYGMSARPEHNGWAISLHGGSNLFYGDLRIYDFWPAKEYNNERKWAAGISLDKEINHYFHVRGNVLYGTLSGTKREYSSGVPANLYFDASLFEYSAVAKLVLGAHNPLSFYTYAGLGFVHFRSEQKDLRNNQVYTAYGYDGDTKTSPTIETVAPVGVGVDYKFTENFSAHLDVSLRIVNTDKLDATISGDDGLFQDMYGYSAVGVSYRFGRNQVNVVPETTQAPSEAPPVQDVPDSGTDEETQQIEEQGDRTDNAQDTESDETEYEDEDELPSFVDDILAEDESLADDSENLDDAENESDYTENESDYNETQADDNIFSEVTESVDTLKNESTDMSEEEDIPGVDDVLEDDEAETQAENRNEDYTKPIREKNSGNTQTSQQNQAVDENNVPIVEESEALQQESESNADDGNVIYRLQILAIQQEPQNEIPKLKKKYGISQTIYEENIGEWTKYTVGSFTSLEQVLAYRKELETKGLKGSFVVPYYQGERISLDEARQLK
ncbi:MAG: hypothetical protein R6U95_04050 [Bacteroidales bacterium]